MPKGNPQSVVPDFHAKSANYAHDVFAQSIGWGMVLLILSLIATPIILYTLATGWFGNRKREVRETFTALLVGFKTGVFDKTAKGAEISKGALA
jgi:hypothetical protein